MIAEPPATRMTQRHVDYIRWLGERARLPMPRRIDVEQDDEALLLFHIRDQATGAHVGAVQVPAWFLAPQELEP